MTVIPSINVDNFKELKKKVELVEPFVSWVHLDIADGTMTSNVTWRDASDLQFLKTNLNIETHLMIDEVEKKISAWLIPKIKRIFFHLRATSNPEFMIEKCKQAGIEPGIAVGPDEPLDEPLKFKEKVRVFQILGVRPGPAGQKTLENTFERIREMKKNCRSCIIEADGGMNKETARKAGEAGADIIVAASYVFNSNNIEEAIHALERWKN